MEDDMWWWLGAAMAATTGASRPTAEPIGYWHPDDLAPLSKRFVSSSERLQEPLHAQESNVEHASAALRKYREGLDLLGDRAPAAERQRLEALEKQYQRDYAVLQQFADQVVTDYDAAFTAAVERAIATLGGPAQQCEAEIPAPNAGPRIPGSKGATVPNPDCEGENLNARLAGIVDQDQELATAIDEIAGREWPVVTLPSEAQAPVGGQDRWLLVDDLMVAGARGPLRAIDQEDDDQRGKIEAAIEQGASTQELASLQPEAARITEQTAAARAALGAPVLAASEKAMTKWKGEPATGWCANPPALGGCTGADASSELVSRLVNDKKVAKAFPDEVSRD